MDEEEDDYDYEKEGDGVGEEGSCKGWGPLDFLLSLMGHTCTALDLWYMWVLVLLQPSERGSAVKLVVDSIAIAGVIGAGLVADCANLMHWACTAVATRVGVYEAFWAGASKEV
jgi:hypothetical protein